MKNRKRTILVLMLSLSLVLGLGLCEAFAAMVEDADGLNYGNTAVDPTTGYISNNVPGQIDFTAYGADNDVLQDSPNNYTFVTLMPTEGIVADPDKVTVANETNPTTGEVEKTILMHDVRVEVGRWLDVLPAKATSTIYSSDPSVLTNLNQRFQDGKYYNRGRGDYPGTAVAKNDKQGVEEIWNVEVYTRPLDFEKEEYVVTMPENGNYYLLMMLKEFEAPVEFYYGFSWTSSDMSVASFNVGNLQDTYCIMNIKKPGTTVVTVSDKYGNSKSTVLKVKPGEKYDFSKDTGDSSVTKPGKVSWASSGALTTTSKKLSLKWNKKSGADGYQVYVSSKSDFSSKYRSAYTVEGKTTKAITKCKKAGTTKALVKGTKYYVKVRAYKYDADGDKVYGSWSTVKSIKCK